MDKDSINRALAEIAAEPDVTIKQPQAGIALFQICGAAWPTYASTSLTLADHDC